MPEPREIFTNSNAICAAASAALAEDARCVAVVDTGALPANIAVLRRLLATVKAPGDKPRLWAVAKADAYGHGLLPILDRLKDADGLGVQTLTEARLCRQAGWRKAIMVHDGLCHARQAAELDLDDLHLVAGCAAQLQWLAQAPAARAAPFVWLRYAGTLRLGGFAPNDYRRAAAMCATLLTQQKITGFGHLLQYSAAEQADGIAGEWRDFLATSGQGATDSPQPLSSCNSAALLQHGAHARATDWVRCGITLYGVSPLPGKTGAELGLRPALGLFARLIACFELGAGDLLGYDGAFQADHAMRVGLVSCGYAYGYPRHARTGTPVLVDGQRSRLLARPSMDRLLIDLSHLPQVKTGALVTLWGGGLAVEEVAASAATIAAELLTAPTARVPRLHIAE